MYSCFDYIFLQTKGVQNAGAIIDTGKGWRICPYILAEQGAESLNFLFNKHVHTSLTSCVCWKDLITLIDLGHKFSFLGCLEGEKLGVLNLYL